MISAHFCPSPVHFRQSVFLWFTSPISFAIMKTVKYCNCSGRSKQQATGLRAASVGAKRVPPGLSTPRITRALAAFAASV